MCGSSGTISFLAPLLLLRVCLAPKGLQSVLLLPTLHDGGWLPTENVAFCTVNSLKSEVKSALTGLQLQRWLSQIVR